jgi:hypothetical protein
MPPDLNTLPEPLELHARLNTHRALDWGEPIPSKVQIAAQYGEGPTSRSLEMLARAAEVELHVTDDFITAVVPGAVSYQLQNRMKSPESLARKLRKTEDYRSFRPPEDLLRYTVVAPDPDDLVAAAGGTVQALRSKGWAMESAHHSYVDGSRYKGLHAFLHCQGQLIELQIHSRESIEVKTRTTPLYVIERDTRHDLEARNAARATCIQLSDAMRQPAGIKELAELGGVPVSARSYGKRRGTGARSVADMSATATEPAQRRHPANHHHRDGIGR